MRILIDITHPAHVHFFKNAVDQFRKRGHEVVVASRIKDITTELLDSLKLQHTVLSKAANVKSIISYACEMITHCWRLYWMARKFKPDVMLQIGGTFIAPVSLFLRCPAVTFYDTEFAKISNMISYPLSASVCTPECYQGKASKNHVKYPGYHELAYLHPNHFSPDPEILKKYRLSDEEKIFIIRFVAWTASHDYNESGFTVENKQSIVDELTKIGTVLISSEAPLPDSLEKYRFSIPIEHIHHILAHATMLIGESATMASEAAVLGVPAIFMSTTGRGYTDEQEKRYGLVKNFKPKQQQECQDYILQIAAKPLTNIRKDYQEKRQKLLFERIDTTEWMINYIEKNFA